MTALRGIWSAALTPVTERYEPDASRAIAYYRDLLDGGCDGLNLLGTSGEAMSFSVEQRLRFMEAIAASGLPLERVMVGTGAASLDDAARLTRGAFDLGFAAALVMPPFFYRGITDDGVLAFFNALFDRAGANGRVVLYNFPAMSGITFHPELVDRLVAQHGERIAGVKDSSNQPSLQAEIVRRQAPLAVFAAAEDYLLEAKAYGVAGCISGSVCLWPSLATHVFESGDAEQARALAEKRRSIAGTAMILAVRAAVARSRNDAAWTRATLPLGGV